MFFEKLKITALAAAVVITGTADALPAECGFQLSFTRPDEGGAQTVRVFRGDPVPQLNGIRPLLFLTSLKVNTDGTKISYHVKDVTGRRCASDPSATPCAINNIRNAFNNSGRPTSDFEAVRDADFPNPKTWQVLSSDIIEKNAQTGKPCISADGYLVSMTADVAVSGGFNRAGDCDQSKWIDALTAPAIVLPKNTASTPSQFRANGIVKRSLVVGLTRSATKRTVFGIVGDLGPVKEIGEANIAMNRKLNGLSDSDQPKHRQDAIDRFQAGRTAVLLFPGDALVLSRPITGERIAEAGANAFSRFGGSDKLYKCIREEIDPTF
ncbi:hypothetical protein HFO24_06710 [Rhizobium laguerreae]|uniref:glycoside hydrolase family 75 protein n=1 Tax=Rhizobium laguerreae TaxID=1076926 RepID=UPI001C92713A|nr:glycoside hydrolase family 75 protein [Rhizobium laguerreae]MBY3181361.1 hypothetical protein [Rhizobium laguerreae]